MLLKGRRIILYTYILCPKSNDRVLGLTQLYHFTIGKSAVVDSEQDKCAHRLPPLAAGCPGINIQQSEPLVIIYFQYMRMPGDKQLRLLGEQHRFYSGGISTRIATDMRH